jgi:hypothetical protein
MKPGSIPGDTKLPQLSQNLKGRGCMFDLKTLAQFTEIRRKQLPIERRLSQNPRHHVVNKHLKPNFL